MNSHGDDGNSIKFDPAQRLAENQVEAALGRCPQLREIVSVKNPIWDWLVQSFDTAKFGCKIIFDTHSLSDENRVAESGQMSETNLFVKVNPTYPDGPKAGQERSAEEILCNLVFELNNLKMTRDYQIIDHLAQCGLMRRDAYINAYAQREYFVLKKMDYFYKNVWLEYCLKNKRQSNPSVWHIPLASTFNEWLAEYPKDSWYPWKVFGKSYDQLIDGLDMKNVYRKLDVRKKDELAEKASKGDPRAQERIGLAFLTREMESDVNNEQLAFNWILKAANQGDLLAEKHLEWMYRLGIGVERDQAESFAWNLKAARKGDAQAEFLLGRHYEQGEGVIKDMTEALYWYKKSADQGYVKAQKYLKDALSELELPKSTMAPALPNK